MSAQTAEHKLANPRTLKDVLTGQPRRDRICSCGDWWPCPAIYRATVHR